MIYDKWVAAFETGDPELLASIHHDDYEAVFHSSGKVMTKADMLAPDAIAWIRTMTAENQRCLYENEDILVVHSFVTYASGDQDALMAVYLKKDCLLYTSPSPRDRTRSRMPSSA